MYKNNQVNSFQPETEHYFEILKYSKIIFYLIEHKIKSYSPLHWSEARLNSIRSNHVLKKFRHCELRATVIFLWCCIFHVCICDLIFLLHLLTSHRKLKGLWIFGEPLWTLDPSEKSNEMAKTIVDIINKNPAQHDLFNCPGQLNSDIVCLSVGLSVGAN